MDEILIEEKKYISSKRAAKITGYAKDYIGQLCREGRVSARLVGRSWYVLETAIQDHRFGDQKIEQKIETTPPTSEHPRRKSLETSTWEAPHYEASPAEVLPSINRLLHPFGGAPSVDSPDTGDIGADDVSVDTDDKNTMAQRLQDSWRAWFDHVGTNTGEVEPSIPNTPEETEIEPTIEEEEDRDVTIPIHVVYEPPPKEFLPDSTKDLSYKQYHNQTISVEEGRVGNKLIAGALKTIGVLVAVILATLAVISSGYFDKYILLVSQVGPISGAAYYIK